MSKQVFPEEPLIHSYLTDCLHEDHPLAYECVYCKTCDAMLHCANNETMQNWFETIEGNYCSQCFVIEKVYIGLRKDQEQ